MKKFTLGTLMAVTTIFMLSSCAKERNKFDKWLTDGSWNLSSYTMTEETNTTSTVMGATSTTKETNSSTFSGGTWTDVWEEVTSGGGTTSTERSETVQSKTCSASFAEEGTYTINTSWSLESASYTSGGTTTSETFVDETLTSMVTSDWAWGRNSDTKATLMMDGVMYHVEITKDELKLTRSESWHTEDHSAIGESDIHTEYTMTESWTWTK